MFKLPFDKIKFGGLKFGKVKFQKPTIVVEIGNDWLKIAEYSPSPSGGEITKIGLQKLAWIRDNMSVALSKTFKDMNLNRQSVVLCIPRHLITVRVLDLPSIDPKEINDMVNLQVGKQTPYSKEEVISTHKIMYSIREGYTKVVLAIAHRSIVNERVETLRNAGINVEKVSISSEGVYNWFSLSYLPEIRLNDIETVALLDIDSNYSDFIAIVNKKLVFTKNIFIGANHLLEKSEWKDKLVEELKRCLERYHTEERNTKIAKMYLSGAARSIEGLDIFLTNSLDSVAENADTFKNIRLKEGLKLAQDQNMNYVSLTPLLGTAIKSASLELDLTPSEQKILKLMEAKRKDLTVMGILFVSIVMVLSFLMLISLYYKNSYLAQLKKKVAETSKESSQIEKMGLSIELVNKNLDAKNSSLNMLHEIYKITPPEISLTSINIDENKQVVLKGRGFAMSDVFKFIKTLEESPMLENVKASYTRTKKEKENDRDIEYAEFEIICPYQR